MFVVLLVIAPSSQSWGLRQSRGGSVRSFEGAGLNSPQAIEAARNNLRAKPASELKISVDALDDPGSVVQVNSGGNDQKKAAALGRRIGGLPNSAFTKIRNNEGSLREFDVISAAFVAQTKVGYSIGSRMRGQARATFEAAIASGRTPYFHSETPFSDEVRARFSKYEKEYGIKAVLDDAPFSDSELESDGADGSEDVK